MKMGVKSAAIAVVGIFAVGIAAASLLGYWKTTSTKQPVKIAQGEFAGMPNPSDIRGSYTWADVAKAFSIDVNLALRAFGATNPDEKVNTLEAIYGEAGLPEGSEIGTDSVRLFVSLLTGLPHAPEGGTILPATAIAVLRESGKGDAAAIQAAADKAFSPSAPKPATVAAPAVAAEPKAAVSKVAEPKTTSSTATTVATPATPASTATTVAPAVEHAPVVGTVTGKTTFKDLKDWGLGEDKIKSVTDGKIGPDSAAIKDWSAANGITFSELKVKLQELLGAK